MQAYFGDLVEHHRRFPVDNLISRMVSAEPDPRGEVLSHAQLVGACSLLLFAGHETTTSLLTSSVFHLTQQADVRRHLATSVDVASTFVDEMLRYDGPSKIVVRRVRRTEDWEGYPFEAGQAVFCALMAGNRDPRYFETPEQLVIDRTPNRHLGFGWGMHYCLGAQLAHLEAEVVIPKVLQRYPEIELGCAVSDLSWHPTIVGRTLRSLPVRLR
jgi:cytochrome P450